MLFGTLTVTYRDNSRDTVKLTGARYTIGSASENDIVLRDPAVAPKQAELRCAESGCELQDLGTTTPTWLGVIRVHPDVIEPLKDGAVILIGRVELTYNVPVVDAPPADSQAGNQGRRWPWRRRRTAKLGVLPRYMLFLLEAFLIVVVAAAVGGWLYRSWQTGAPPFRHRPIGASRSTMTSTLGLTSTAPMRSVVPTSSAQRLNVQQGSVSGVVIAGQLRSVGLYTRLASYDPSGRQTRVSEAETIRIVLAVST